MESTDPTLAPPPPLFPVVRSTWLSRPPDPIGWPMAALATLFLLAGSLLNWFLIDQGGSGLAVSGEAVFVRHEYWRLWTAVFAHSDMGHLLSNSLLFSILGAFMAGQFGTLLFPILAFGVGGLINLASVATYPREVTLLGASGVVFWMGGTWLALYLMIDRSHSWLQRILRAAGVALVLFVPSETFNPTVSYRTHGFGFLIGALSGLAWYAWHRRTFRAADVIEMIE